jgi:broad specificity phosphatase PhoE
MASTIYLIRHGQASFMADDYDRLSHLGEQQSRALGQWWQNNLPISPVLHGTLKRQVSTFRIATETWANPPQAQVKEGLNEHQGTEIMRLYRDQYPPLNSKREALRQFFKVNRQWARGEIDSGPYESWADFQQRVRTTMADILAHLTFEESIILLTSGGVIATAIGMALNLEEEKIMELNWQIRNTSISAIQYSKGRLFLRDFNGVPHLQEEQISYV